MVNLIRTNQNRLLSSVDKIRLKMANYPDIYYEYDDQHLIVPPINSNGFGVALLIRNNKFTVYFDDWHEDFDDEEEALNFFAFGLSNSVRIEVHQKGNHAYKRVLQYLDEGTWHNYDTQFSFIFPYWRDTEVYYLINHLIHDDIAEEVY